MIDKAEMRLFRKWIRTVRKNFYQILLLVAFLVLLKTETYYLHNLKNFNDVESFDEYQAYDGEFFEDNDDTIDENSIDIVYTWVNGSDPNLIDSFNSYKLIKAQNEYRQVEFEEFYQRLLDGESTDNLWPCYYTNCIQKNNLFIVTPGADAKTNEYFTSLARHLDDDHFYSNLTVFNLFQTTLISLGDYDLASNLTILNAFRKLINQVYGQNNHRIYLAFYTTDEPISPNLLKFSPENANFLLQMSLSIQSRILIYLKFKKEPRLLKIVRTNGSELIVHALEGRLFYSIDENEHYMVKKLNIVWDLGTQWTSGLKKNRLVDKNELKFSLRSVEAYVPWVRYIFIVTNGQIPGWLNVSHPKIRLVKHEQIFVNKSHLPTFNSAAIESHLHRIEGLSRKFLYFNDDLMLTAPVSLSDFYETSTRTHKFYFSWTIISESSHDDGQVACDSSSEYVCSTRYVNRLFNEKFGHVRLRGVPAHMPFLIDRELMEQLQSQYRKEFEQTSSNRFRSPTDMQYAFAYSNYIISKFKKLNNYRKNQNTDQLDLPINRSKFCDESYYDDRKCSHFMRVFEKIVDAQKNKYKYSIQTIDDVKYLSVVSQLDLMRNRFGTFLIRKKKFLCVNDEIDYESEILTNEIIQIMNEFLETLFPAKSSFEI